MGYFLLFGLFHESFFTIEYDRVVSCILSEGKFVKGCFDLWKLTITIHQALDIVIADGGQYNRPLFIEVSFYQLTFIL